MQSSPSTGQQLKQATIKSPATAVALRPESSTSPRRDSAQLSSRSPNAHPALTGTLRMGSFYEIDGSFTRLREALKPNPKAAKTSALPAVLDELHGTIKVSTLEAERAFTQRSYAACKLHLAAAKSNQVLMLGKIDSIAEADVSDDRRSGIRSACGEIGAALTRMLIQATTLENASTQERIVKQKARGIDSDSDDGPPSSPPPAEQTPGTRHNSPARSTHKRTQSDADSPVLAQSPGKRQKIDAAISRTTTTTTTATDATATATSTTTSTTASVPQSPPAYRPAPKLQIEHLASGATSVGSPSKPATAASTGHASAIKMRTLSPQARPRPRSQLFVAPPDFTSQVRDDPAHIARAAAPAQVPPGPTPTNAAEGAQPGADSSGLRS